MAYDEEKELNTEEDTEKEEIDSILTETADLRKKITSPPKTDSSYVSQFGELDEFIEEDETLSENEPSTDIAVQLPQKKKASTKKAVIIATLCVLLFLAIGLGVYFVFFNNSIYGTWVNIQTTSDGTEISTYYKFTKDYIENYQTDGYTYKKTTYNDVQYKDNTFSIIQDGKIYMRCPYSITGNLIQGKKMAYSIEGYETYSDIELTKIFAKDIPGTDVLKEATFKVNKDILGTWEYSENVDYMEYFVFDENGYMTIFSGDNSNMVESIQRYNFDGKTLSLYNAQEPTQITTEVKGNKLSVTIENLYIGTLVRQYNKVSAEDFEAVKEKLKTGEYEIPTAAQIPTPTETSTPAETSAPAETSTDSTT